MPGLKMEQIQSLQMRQELRQILRMEQADLLEMPDDEFHRLIVAVESSPSFQKLYRGKNLIRYQRFPRTNISSGFYPLKEEVIADSGSLDVELLLVNRRYIVDQIQNLGLEKFRRYFLLPETGMTIDDIARECSLDVAEVRKINNLIDEFSIASEFYHPSNTRTGTLYYSKVASVEKDGGDFTIGYYSAAFARGRYSIDYERFEALRVTGALPEAEVKEARQLFKRLELINSRKDTLTRILQSIVARQALYLSSGDLKALLPFSQKELAKKLGVAPSSVSRAIKVRSIDTPWGQEVPLKEFFPRPKRFKKELLSRLLESKHELASDEAIRGKLREKFGVAISRRSVANLRAELKFPPAKRKQHPAGVGIAE